MADSLTEEELARLEALHAEAIAERDGRICTMVAASRFLQELAHHAPALLASARAVRRLEQELIRFGSTVEDIKEFHGDNAAYRYANAWHGIFKRALTATAEPTAGEEL